MSQEYVNWDKEEKALRMKRAIQEQDGENTLRGLVTLIVAMGFGSYGFWIGLNWVLAHFRHWFPTLSG